MKRSDLEVLLNEKTGSAFHVLAKTPKYVCAIRLFIGPTEEVLPSLFFRIRVEKNTHFMSNQPYFKLALEEDFPKVQWSKVSTNYGSVVGSFVLSCSAADHEGMLNLYSGNKMAAHIYAYLTSCFGEMQFSFSETGFVELCDDYMTFLIHSLGLKLPALAAGQTLFTLPGQVHLLKEGFEVTTIELEDVVSSSNPDDVQQVVTTMDVTSLGFPDDNQITSL